MPSGKPEIKLPEINFEAYNHFECAINPSIDYNEGFSFKKDNEKEVDWSKFSNLSFLDFIYEFKDELDIDKLIEMGVITRERLEELEHKNTIHSRFEILDID